MALKEPQLSTVLGAGNLLYENAKAAGHYLDELGDDCQQRAELEAGVLEELVGHGQQMTRTHCGLCYAVASYESRLNRR